MASENEKRETLADVVAIVRRAAQYYECEAEKSEGLLRETLKLSAANYREIANLVEAAAKRNEERAVEHATRHAEAVARDNCRDCVHNPNGKNYEGVGNAAAMREALNDIVGIANIALNVNCVGNSNNSELWNIIDKAKAALSEPARQCDVGTADEQNRRFDNFCRGKDCKTCPCNTMPRCHMVWAQMPYEEQEGGEK